MEDQPIFERSSDRNENAGIAQRPKRGENHLSYLRRRGRSGEMQSHLPQRNLS